jgi:hypothetical protein
VVITGGTKISPRLSRSGVFRFCEGDSLVLQAQEGFAAYRWSTSAISSRIVVRSDGTYSVRVTDQYGCEWDSDSIRISVDTNPIEITGLPGTKLVIDSTRPHQLRCDSLRIRNNSAEELTISVARLLRNIEFSVPQSQLSLVLQPQEIRTLGICYQPSQMFLQQDTLVIGDYCNRVLIVESTGIPDNYTASTRCAVPLNGSTAAINTNGLYVYPAYPQPASATVTIRMRYTRGEQPESVTLVDILGNSIEIPLLARTDIGVSGTTAEQEWRMDVSAVPEGVYALRVATSGGQSAVMLRIVR